MRAYRCDFGTFRKPLKTAQGYLKADGLATRVGVFKYRLEDGTVQREFRPPEEVYNKESLDTLAAVPVTNDHPPVMLDAKNTKVFAVGFTSENVEIDEGFVKVGITITDDRMIEQVENREKQELSCGYFADLDMAPGIFKGEPYDVVQKNIRYNHLAIVDRGRAGPEARIRIDKDQGLMVEEGPEETKKEVLKMDNKENKGVSQARIKLDDIEYEVSEALAQVVMDKQSALEKANNELEFAQEKISELKGRCDSLEQEIEKVKKDKPSRKTLLKEARDRIDLENFAKEVLGEDAKFDDETNDAEIRKKILQKLQPKLHLEEREDAYIEAAFDVAKEGFERKDDKGEKLKKNIGDGTDKNNDEENSAVVARNRMIQNSRNSWKETPKA